MATALPVSSKVIEAGSGSPRTPMVKPFQYSLVRLVQVTELVTP